MEVKQMKIAEPQGSHNDPITDVQASELLTLVDVVRDPLHGDIRLTALERYLIDTPAFQRLRNINQLAMTYIAYPGAVHTRFLHSLGVLHVAAEMLATCNKNAETYRRLAGPQDPKPLQITKYCEVLVRLCALLHDLAHIPFGHTLEKEGGVIKRDEWSDPWRVERLFGKSGEIRQALKSFFKERSWRVSDADNLTEQIKGLLTTSRKEAHHLPYPFVHDLVGNTICADLLDYVQRDMYFCGLTETLAKRFLDYLAVIPLRNISDSADSAENSDVYEAVASETETVFPTRAEPNAVACRLVLLQYRYNERRTYVQKHDVIAEAIDLIRRRLAVAEKLYFHRTKVAASAMLTAAAQFGDLTDASSVWELSDAEVLKTLAAVPSTRAQKLARALRSRKLYKPIYRISARADSSTQAGEKLWARNGIYERFRKPDARSALTERLERLIGLNLDRKEESEGAVVISCPDNRMNLKGFEMLVLAKPDSPTIQRLQESALGPTRKEIEAIQDTHKHLWRLEVFVDPTVVNVEGEDEFTDRLAGAIQHEVGLPNEVPEFSGLPSLSLDELEENVGLIATMKELDIYDKMTIAALDQFRLEGFKELGERDLRQKLVEFAHEKGYLTDEALKERRSG